MKPEDRARKKYPGGIGEFAPRIGLREVSGLARKCNDIKIRIFVGDRPLEELTPEEKSEYGKKAAQRMGEVFNRYFNEHPEVLEKL